VHKPAAISKITRPTFRSSSFQGFQLDADILSTAIAPSWDQIDKLAAIAIIRTGLNFFLSRVMYQERQQEIKLPPEK
jgi:uncharacterized membrane protein